MAAHRADGRWWHTPRGNGAQPDGRHTEAYVELHEGTGMYPLGHAGRESLAQHAAAGEERGDRNSAAARATAARNRGKRAQ